MGEAQGILGHPSTGLFMMLIIGGLAGWIAGMITEFRHGLFTNILVGMAGAFIGGKLAEVLEIPVVGFWRVLICAIVGAIIILFVWQRIRPRQAP
jgi:uncharacterized membrane protein YeaQ/YmgE (transglycosylase-associated protein family)